LPYGDGLENDLVVLLGNFLGEKKKVCLMFVPLTLALRQRQQHHYTCMQMPAGCEGA
jgi:hypothetical protein